MKWALGQYYKVDSKDIERRSKPDSASLCACARGDRVGISGLSVCDLGVCCCCYCKILGGQGSGFGFGSGSGSRLVGDELTTTEQCPESAGKIEMQASKLKKRRM